MPSPLTVSCFSKIQIGFTFLVPAHPCSPGKRAVKRMCVCVCVLNCSLNYHYYRCCCWCAIWLSLAVLCWLLLVYVVIICRRCGYWCRLHRSTTCRTHRVFQFVSQAASVRTRHSRSPRKYSTVRSYLLWHAIDNMLKLGIALRQKAIMLCSLKVQNLWQCCNMISFNGFGYVFKKFPHI